MRHRIPCRSRLQSHADALRNPPLFRCAICAQCRAESAPVPGSKAVQSEAMESTQIQALYEPPLAAMPQLSEKPRHGFETWKTEAKPRSSSCNFTVTLGLRATVVENGVRETYSARYYNPITGRFMSRDPEKGHPTKPASLHKYLYAHGDPVNLKDPTGRDAMVATAEIDFWEAVKNTVAVAAAGAAVVCSLNRDAELLGGITRVLSSGETIESITFGVCTARVKGKKNCNERHLVEQTFCVAEYGLHPTILFQCMERAMWRWNNCLRGLPDPGPLDPLDPFWSQH